MAYSGNRTRQQHLTLWVFLGTASALGGALAWFCWRTLELDRQLESQRARERLEQIADRIAEVLAAKLEQLDRALPLAAAGADAPPGITLLRIADGRLSVQPRGLPYLPDLQPDAARGEDLDAAFAAAERSEFQDRAPAAAAEQLRALCNSPNLAVRAGAMVRLARNLKKLGRSGEALEVYARLARLKDARIEGVPAELMAFEARCALLETSGRRAELRAEAQQMDAGLRSGRWSMDEPVWEFHRQQAGRWLGGAPLSDAELDALGLSRAAGWISRLGPRPAEAKGRRALAFDGRPLLLSWTAEEGRVAAALLRPAELRAAWNRAAGARGVSAALLDMDNSVLLGTRTRGGRREVRSLASAGLPATLVTASSDPAADSAAFVNQRRFQTAGFAALGLILVAGCGFILHSMARERALAKMQSEFVSAVSHEFRTPLTSLRQLSEMLAGDRIANGDDRRHAYQAMYQATERLRRLVESLLDFGRMEAAAFRYTFEPMDMAALVAKVAGEFRQQAAQGHAIEVAAEENLPAIAADREAIGLALWNLLDNAVKYSPQAPRVWMETRREGAMVAISVRDSGIGIPPAELRVVFQRFYRGAGALAGNFQGTGIGLSIARHVVRAHGGDLRLASPPGQGVTATILLPVERTA